jgi:hypothetical protein
MSDPKERSAYVVASQGVNVLPLVEALASRGVSARKSSLLLGPAQAEQDVIFAIRSADMVIGVLREREPDLNVMIELGIALGYERPILLFGGVKSQIPSNLRKAAVVVRMDLWNDQLFLTHLDPFMERLSSYKEPIEPRTHTDIPGQSLNISDFEAVLKHFRSMESESRIPNEAESVQLLASLFRAAGYIASINERRPPGHGWLRPDLAVWAEDLPPDMGSPLLIEIAFHNAMVQQRRQQFQRLLQEFNTKGGLIVTWRERDRPATADNPNNLRIPTMSVREVVNLLKLGIFAEVYLLRASVDS